MDVNTHVPAQRTDCDTETVEVYRKPADDAYHDVSHVSGAATVTPRAFPDVELALAEIFA